MTVAIATRTLAQGVVFLIVARVLGIRDYGAYAAILALATAIGSMGGMGVHALMVREVSRNSACFSTAWGYTLAAVLASTPPLFIVYLLLAWVLIPFTIPFSATLLIGVSEVVLTPVIVVAMHAFQSQGQIGKASWVYFLPVVPRFFGALLLLPAALFSPPGFHLTAWAVLYFAATLVTVIGALRMVRGSLGEAIMPGLPRIWAKLKEGFPFALSSAALKLYADIDKTMLARLSTLEATGAYSASYRVVDLATVPATSLMIAAAPRFFRAGEGGVGQALSFARRILAVPLILTLLASLTMFLGAELLPWVLGPGYESAVPALRWLAWLPCLSLVRLLLQTVLIGSDRQNQVVATLLAGAAVNIGLNFLLIPVSGWQGAVIATYVAEAIMIGALFIIALRAGRGPLSV